MPKRQTLPQKVQVEILYNSAFACAVCQSKGDHIHHIDQNNSNNDSDNLILLCQGPHDEAHTKRDLSKNLTPQRLKIFRKKWYLTIEEKREKASLAQRSSDNENSFSMGATWGYINHVRLIQSIPRNLVPGANPSLFDRLNSAGVLDNSGIPIKPDTYIPSDFYTRNTIYDYYDYELRFALHIFYSDLVNFFIKNNKIIYVDEPFWNRTFVKQMISPGAFVFVNKAQYFKKIHEEQTNAEVSVRTFKNKLEIQYEVNTRNMFGTTSITSSFSGHRTCASLLQVKSIEDIDKRRILHCTPLALGVGFYT